MIYFDSKMQMPSEESASTTQIPPCVSEGFLFESSDDESAPSAPLYSPISKPDLESCHSSSIDSSHEEVESTSTETLSLEDIQPLETFEDDHSVLTESQKDIQPPAAFEDDHSVLTESQKDVQPPAAFEDVTPVTENVTPVTEYMSTVDAATSEKHKWCGFKVVGDNIDKNIRPSFHRLQHQTQSLHYFHCYAVKDRVDLSDLPDASSSPACVDATDLIITEDEWTRFKDDCCVLVSRYVILVKYLLLNTR